MIAENGEKLRGGLMNTPIHLEDKVYRKATKSTGTIHHLLKHVRSKGIKWVPEPISFDADTEVLSFMKGEVPSEETKNDALMKNAFMYKRHSVWIQEIL